MLAVVQALVAFTPLQAAGVTPALRRSVVLRVAASPRCDEAMGLPSMPAVPAVPDVDSAAVTDTILDVLVYGLIAGVAGLTLYSIVVTLQASNDQYGGWTKQDDDDVQGGMLERPSSSLVSGARYDPVTESWTYPTAEEQAAKAKVGRAPAAAPAESANRYERRIAKKQKQKKKKR